MVLPRKSCNETSFPFSSCKVNWGALSWIFMEIFSPACSPACSPVLDPRAASNRWWARPLLFQKILHGSLVLFAALTAVGSVAVWSAAQEPTPEIVPLEKKNRAPKKDLGPRALGLLRMTPTGKATLVPVMIEIEGKFYDASAYKADPVPMALESGTVYEGQKTGVSVGLFTVNSALHSLAANTDTPWLATGAWLAAGAQPTKIAMKAEAVPVGIESTDGPPRLSKGETSSSNAAPATTSSTPPASTPPASGSSPTEKPAEKKEEKKDEKTTQQKPAAQPEAPAPKVQSTSSDDARDDTHRPRLRRGKPTGPVPDYDVPGYARPLSARDATTGRADNPAAKPDAAAAAMEPVELVPAISDAAGPELRSFAYEWDKEAEEQRRKQMLDLAKIQLRAYIDARAKGQIPATPVPKTPTTRKSPSKAAKPVIEPIFDNVQMRTFDLWGSNQPVLVLSADAHLPAKAATGAADLPSAPLQYKILLAARTDIYGNLHKLHSGVTDRFHLDVIPQL